MEPDPKRFEGGEIEPELEKRAGFSETLAQNGFHDVLVLSRERASLFRRSRSLAIIDHLKEHGPSSTEEIADRTGHLEYFIDEDLAELAGIDVIEYDSEGIPRLKHNHVVIEPIV